MALALIRMNYLLALFLLSIGNLSLNAQDYDYINRAEKLINANKNLPRALKLLDKAVQGDYGFCGNAYASAFWNMHYLRARVYNEQKEYLLGLKELDSITSCAFGGNCSASDSLKFEILNKAFDKSKILKSLESLSDSLIYRDSLLWSYRVCIDLELIEYTFCFFVNKDLMANKKSMTLKEILTEMNIYAKFEE